MDHSIPALRWGLPMALVIGVLPASVHARAQTPSLAPQSPEFSAWQQGRRSIQEPASAPSSALPAHAAPAHATPSLLGYAPSPVDLSHIRGMALPGRALAGFASSYDLRALSQVTKIRDQYPYGACWAFASLASLESSLLKAERGTYDLSEWHLGWYVYNDFNANLVSFTKASVGSGEDSTYDQGGNTWQATAILARGSGAVTESLCPYKGAHPTGSEANAVTLQNAHYLGADFDATNVKTALQTYGAVTIALNADSGMQGSTDSTNYNATTHAFRDTVSANTDVNHMVVIVGWDDTYAPTNFPSGNQPASSGAWIVRNSWGTGWGDKGYFYISYDSKVFEGVAFTSGAAAWSRVYQYDALGWVSNIGFGSETAYGANVFTAQATEAISAISFYAASPSTAYEIQFRTGVTGDPSTGTPVSGGAWPQRGTTVAPGYSIIRLDSPVMITAGQKFAVVVKLTTPGYTYPIPVESPQDKYSEKATSGAGESYFSLNGSAWMDLSTNTESANSSVCIKAFAGKSMDLDINGTVDVEDMAVLCRSYNLSQGASGYSATGDLNSDGVVDDSDISLFLFYF